MTWGNKTQEGMVSIAHVMRNRAISGAYGDTNGGLTKAIVAPKQFSMWNNDDPKLRALAASAKEARPTNDPRYQRDGGRRWRVFRSDPRPHQGRDPLPHPRCVAGLVGGQNAGGDDR